MQACLRRMWSGRLSGGWLGVLAIVSLIAIPSVGGVGAHECSKPGGWFRMNVGVTGWRDCHLRAWVVQYYYPDDHDPQWLALELRIKGQLRETTSFRPDDVYIVQPDGSRVPLISQRTYRQQRSSMAPLLLQMRGGGNRSPGGCQFKLRFFVDQGTRRQLADVALRCVSGYLYFAAPTGRWESGTYVLAVDGDVGLRMPVVIE